MNKLLGILVLIAGIGCGFNIFAFSYQLAQTPAPIAYGSFNPTGGGTYYLQSTISNNQTTITLSSFLEPGSNIPYTMSYLNSSIEYGTIAPQSTQSEFISFTGISQNGDGSATLTGVQRGLERSYPYVASSTLTYPHAGQTRFILSNPPQLTNQYVSLANSGETITGSKTVYSTFTYGSTTPPTYDVDPVWANFSTQVFADVAYVNSVVAAGAANSSESVKGIVQLATAAQAALGTSLGSTGARLALGANLATSTPGLSTVTGDVVTTTGSKIVQSFLDLTANWTFSTTTAYTTNIGTLTATTSARLPANTTIGGLTPLFTTTIPRYTATSLGSFSGTSSVLTIPAGVLTASSTIYVSADTSCSGGSSPVCRYYLRDALTSKTLDVCAFTGINSGNLSGPLTMVVANQSSLSSQIGTCNGIVTNGSTASVDIGGNATSALNTANAVNLVLVANLEGGSGSLLLSNYSIVVTP